MDNLSIKMAIASRLKEQRIKYKISRKLLSGVSDVSYSSIRRFEETGDISLDNLISIAICLKGYYQIKNLFEYFSPGDPKVWCGVCLLPKRYAKKDKEACTSLRRRRRRQLYRH